MMNPKHRYRSVEEIGWILRVGDTKSGTVVNSITHKLLRGIGRDFMTSRTMHHVNSREFSGTLIYFKYREESKKKKKNQSDGQEKGMQS